MYRSNYSTNDNNLKLIFSIVGGIVTIVVCAFLLYFFNVMFNGNTEKFKADIVSIPSYGTAEIQWYDEGSYSREVDISSYSHVKVGDTLDIKVKKPGILDVAASLGTKQPYEVEVTDHNLNVFKYWYRVFHD